MKNKKYKKNKWAKLYIPKFNFNNKNKHLSPILFETKPLKWGQIGSESFVIFEPSQIT